MKDDKKVQIRQRKVAPVAQVFSVIRSFSLSAIPAAYAEIKPRSTLFCERLSGNLCEPPHSLEKVWISLKRLNRPASLSPKKSSLFLIFAKFGKARLISY